MLRLAPGGGRSGPHMSQRVERQLWQQGSWIIEFTSACTQGDFCGGSKAVTVSRMGWSVEKCWHPARFWRRNRTLMECLCEALEWVTQQNEAEADAHAEANLLAEEASALAEAAQSLASLSRA